MTKSRRQDRPTPAQELESRVLDSAQRQELTFRATNDVLYEFDLANGTVTWNDAFYSKFGYPKKDNESRLEWWTSHIHPDDSLELGKVYNDWFESKKDLWEAEYRFRKADGGYIVVRDRGLLQRASDGSPLRIIGSLIDITEQKQLDRAKDEFISLVSHQLRTPLTVIRLYSEMLIGGLFGDLNLEQATRVQQIDDATVRLIKLVGDILDVSKVELGTFTSNPSEADANKLIRTYIDEVLPLATAKGVSIHFKPKPSIKTLALDGTIFAQIMHNLLTNAIRYTKPQKGTIDVSFSRNKTGYLLCVKDNGIGIPKTAQAHIFNRFFRAGNTANINEHGTGLGLYLVRKMATAAGCEVWFESAAGKGAAFYVRIPLSGMHAN